MQKTALFRANMRGKPASAVRDGKCGDGAGGKIRMAAARKRRLERDNAPEEPLSVSERHGRFYRVRRMRAITALCGTGAEIPAVQRNLRRVSEQEKFTLRNLEAVDSRLADLLRQPVIADIVRCLHQQIEPFVQPEDHDFVPRSA